MNNIILPKYLGLNTDEDNGEFCESFSKNLNNKYQITRGVQKLVLIPNSHKVVYKIPFNIEYYNLYSKNCTLHASLIMEDPCRKEIDIYKQAKKQNLQDIFAEITQIDTINNHPIYIQEYCWGKQAFPASSSLSIVKDNKDLHSFNSIWLNDALSYYSEDYITQVISLLADNRIILDFETDENLKYTKDNRPVIIDWGLT